MKLKHNKWLMGLLLLVNACTSLYAGDFTYRREIKGITSTWHKLVIPADMMGRVNRQLSDIRIIGVTEKNDTVEAPYIGNLHIETTDSKQIGFKLLNQTKNAKGYYCTFEIEDGKSINLIDLDLKDQNFDWKVSLGGSNDQKEWFSVLDDYRLVSIKNELTDYRFTTLKFPESQYRYYRLLVPAVTKPNLTGAKIIRQVLTPGIYDQCQMQKMSVQTDKQRKETTIDIELSANVPVSRLSIKVADSVDFCRPVVVQYLYDSTKTVKGWEYSYSELTSGVLSSVEPQEFRFANIVTRHLRLIIANGDNAPLHVVSVSAKGNVYSLTVRFPQTANYYLYYGNKSLGQPDYDLANFKDKIPTALSVLTLGSEELLAKTPAQLVKPLFQNKAWLWVVMSVIILLLGWFSIKMIITKN